MDEFKGSPRRRKNVGILAFYRINTALNMCVLVVSHYNTALIAKTNLGEGNKRFLCGAGGEWCPS